MFFLQTHISSSWYTRRVFFTNSYVSYKLVVFFYKLVVSVTNSSCFWQTRRVCYKLIVFLINSPLLAALACHRWTFYHVLANACYLKIKMSHNESDAFLTFDARQALEITNKLYHILTEMSCKRYNSFKRFHLWIIQITVYSNLGNGKSASYEAVSYGWVTVRPKWRVTVRPRWRVTVRPRWRVTVRPRWMTFFFLA